jgi:hypothetical protein
MIDFWSWAVRESAELRLTSEKLNDNGSRAPGLNLHQGEAFPFLGIMYTKNPHHVLAA